MNDVELEYVLHVVGYVAASHVMSRASLSTGIGRDEEILTADIQDIFARFRVANDYLRFKNSTSRVGIHVEGIDRRREGRIGADFIIAIHATDTNGTTKRVVRKVALIQAKRLDFKRRDASRYAASSNHVAHAKQMARRLGLSNAFFAFYHSDAVIPHVTQRVVWPGARHPPELYFANPNHGNHSYFGVHPDMQRETFIEPSAYRDLQKKRTRSWQLASDYEWGIAVVSADVFLTPGLWKKRSVSASRLPTVQDVLGDGWAFQTFLVSLATCDCGSNFGSDQDWSSAIDRAMGSHEENTAAGGIDPRFAAVIQCVSGSAAATRSWRPARSPADDVEEYLLDIRGAPE